jgi:SAM-dependent methyltransferase
VTGQRDPGAPLGLYKILRPAGEPELIDSVVPSGAAILDLGCGTGRVTNALAELGRTVVAVDFDERMLEHVRGAETVLSRIEDLALGRVFGGVVLMSNLVNVDDEERRSALLATCRRHVARDGVVLIQRYDPRSGLDDAPSETTMAGVTMRTSDLRRDGHWFSYTIEYEAGEQGRWGFRVERARILDDEEMRTSLAQAGLRLDRWLDPRRRWLAAVPV